MAVCVEAKRELPDKAPAVQRQYDFTDLDPRGTGKNAGSFAQRVPRHWSIGNQLHGSLDVAVAVAEDDCHVRQGHTAENLARLNRMALNPLKREKPANAASLVMRKQNGAG